MHKQMTSKHQFLCMQDLVPGWYAQVGQSITVIVIFTVGLLHPAFVCYRSAHAALLIDARGLTVCRLMHCIDAHCKTA